METPRWLNRPFRVNKLVLPIDDGRVLAQAIVDTIREPLLVLDKDLCVVTKGDFPALSQGAKDAMGRG